jgi:hypothetical protein
MFQEDEQGRSKLAAQCDTETREEANNACVEAEEK